MAGDRVILDEDIFSEEMEDDWEIKFWERAIREHLREKEAAVMRYYFGMDDGHDKTLQETASFFGLTVGRVRQIEYKLHRLAGCRGCHIRSNVKRLEDVIFDSANRTEENFVLFLSRLQAMPKEKQSYIRHLYGLDDGRKKTVFETGAHFGIHTAVIRAVLSANFNDFVRDCR